MFVATSLANDASETEDIINLGPIGPWAHDGQIGPTSSSSSSAVSIISSGCFGTKVVLAGRPSRSQTSNSQSTQSVAVCGRSTFCGCTNEAPGQQCKKQGSLQYLGGCDFASRGSWGQTITSNCCPIPNCDCKAMPCLNAESTSHPKRLSTPKQVFHAQNLGASRYLDMCFLFPN